VIQLTEVVGTVAAEGDDLVGRLHSPLTTYKMAEASLITLSRTATGTNGHYTTATGASVQQTAGGGQARGGGGLGSTSRGGNAQGGSGYDSRYYRAAGKLKTNGHSGVAYLEWELEQ
jgi:hypothetical protein